MGKRIVNKLERKTAISADFLSVMMAEEIIRKMPMKEGFAINRGDAVKMGLRSLLQLISESGGEAVYAKYSVPQLE